MKQSHSGAPLELDEAVAANERLRSEMHKLLKQGHINQQIMQRHQDFDLRLIGSGSFRELIETVSRAMPHTFNLETVTLTLIDSGYEIRRILADLQIGVREFPTLLFLDAALTGSDATPSLGPYDSARHRDLFPAYTPTSVAILPLLRQRKTIGYLSLGSAHKTRFAKHLATDFIERLASIVAICLENVINNERLKHIGLTDPLTGVSNRRYIEQRMSEEIVRAQRERSALSLLFLDIDFFKLINDSCGHQGGDVVLCEVAARIKNELRLSDSLARFGGEEFVVLLTQATLDDAMRIGERIRASVAASAIGGIAGHDAVNVTISAGAATMTAPSRLMSAEELKTQLLAHADAALYRAKESGRNRVVAADDDIAVPVPVPMSAPVA